MLKLLEKVVTLFTWAYYYSISLYYSFKEDPKEGVKDFCHWMNYGMGGFYLYSFLATSFSIYTWVWTYYHGG